MLKSRGLTRGTAAALIPTLNSVDISSDFIVIVFVLFRPDRSCCHHINNLRDKSQLQRSSPDASTNRHLPSATTPGPLPHPPHNPPPALTPLPTPPPKKEHLVQETPQTSRKESRSHTSTHSGASTASSHSHSKGSSKGTSSTHRSESHKQKTAHREEKYHTPSESADRDHRSSDPSKDSCGSEKTGRKSERSRGRNNSQSRRNNDEERHRSHRTKSPPPQGSKGANSSGEKRIHERRQDTVGLSTTDSEICAAHACKESSSRAARREQRRSSDGKDQKKVCSKHHSICEGDCSKERLGGRPSKGESRKEERPHTAKLDRKSERSSSSERSRKRAKHSSKDSHHRDTCREEGQNHTQDVLKACDKADITVKSRVEENSSNRKLCFMETLNLTRSPIKKAALPSDGHLASVDTTDDGELMDGSSQLDMENMQVIDEVKAQELQDVVEEPQKPRKGPQAENCEDEMPLQVKDKDASDLIVCNLRVEDHLVQAVPAYVQPISTEEKGRSVQLTHTSPDSSSFQEGNEHTISNNEDSTKMTSHSHVDGSESVEPSSGATECNSLAKNTSGNLSDQSASETNQKCTPKTTAQTSDKDPVSSSPPKDNVPDAACLQSPQAAVLSRDPDGACSPATCSPQEKDSDVVSSTISLDSLPQEGLSLPDAIYILTQTGDAACDVVSTTEKMGSLAGCDAVSKISSTTQEGVLPDTQGEPTVTPKKSCSPGKSQENTSEPPSSKPLLHDEDSMMSILSNLMRIPDVISPLRSPIQASKRSHHCSQNKPGHVKSLEKGNFGLISFILRALILTQTLCYC